MGWGSLTCCHLSWGGGISGETGGGGRKNFRGSNGNVLDPHLITIDSSLTSLEHINSWVGIWN